MPAILLLVLWLEPNPPVLCLWTRLFGVHCLGCGMHHALFALVRGRFHAAWQANHLVFVVLPLLVGLYLRTLVRLRRSLVD